jgi:hypothetical protein
MLGALISIWQRQPVALVVPWVVIVILIANPHLVGLPGAGLMTNFAIALALYIPVSALVGSLGGAAFGWLQNQRYAPAATTAGALLVLALGFYGAYTQSKILNYNYQLVTAADERAMSWIRSNTEPDSRFLSNGMFAYGGSLVAGSDAGWWLPLLASRANTIPPMLYGSEAASEPDYITQVQELYTDLADSDLDDPQTIKMLQAHGIEYVYIGEKGGPLLRIEELQRSARYQEVYHEGGVWIFEIRSE